MSTNNEENKNVMLESHRKDDPDKKPGVHNNSSGGMNPNTKKKWQFSIRRRNGSSPYSTS